VGTDAGIRFAIDGQLRRHFNVGAVEVGQFLLPIRVFKFEEERAENIRGIK
jgi:hypothetical protein